MNIFNLFKKRYSTYILSKYQIGGNLPSLRLTNLMFEDTSRNFAYFLTNNYFWFSYHNKFLKIQFSKKKYNQRFLLLRWIKIFVDTLHLNISHPLLIIGRENSLKWSTLHSKIIISEGYLHQYLTLKRFNYWKWENWQQLTWL